MVLAGIKPLAVVEKRKNREQYLEILRHGPGTEKLAISMRIGPEGREAIIAQSTDLIQQYLDALKMPIGDARTWCLGRLFGYSDEDIAEFITNPPECDCSKCKGGAS